MGRNKKGKGGQSKKNQNDSNIQSPQNPSNLEEKTLVTEYHKLDVGETSQYKKTVGESSRNALNVQELKSKDDREPTSGPGVRDFPKNDSQTFKEIKRGARKQKYQQKEFEKNSQEKSGSSIQESGGVWCNVQHHQVKRQPQSSGVAWDKTHHDQKCGGQVSTQNDNYINNQNRSGGSGDNRKQQEKNAWSEIAEGETKSHEKSPEPIDKPSTSATSLSSNADNISELTSIKKFEGDKIFSPGKLGRSIPILTNHFELFLGRVKTIIMYDVAFEPDRPKKLLKEAFRAFKETYLKNNKPAFDGRKIAFSARELPFGLSKCETVTVIKDDTKTMEFKVTLTRVKEVDLQALLKYIGNKNECDPTPSIQALDIILGHTLMMRNIKVGASYFKRPETNVVDLGQGMELYRGSFQSVNLGAKPFLNIDVANKAFPKSQSIVSLISELCRFVDVRKVLDERNRTALDKYIRNLKIEFRLPMKPSSKRHYTVNSVHSSAASTNFNYEFEPGVFKAITVEEYFKKMHGVILEYPEMPCLWVGPKNKTIYLPCELCKILPDQAIPSKLNPFQTTKMIRSCATNTKTRKDLIGFNLKKANYNNDPIVKEFDLTVSEDFKKLEGRVLIPPILQYKNESVNVSNGEWRATEFLVAANIESWTILSLDYNVKANEMEDLARSLMTGARVVGMLMKPPVRPFRQLRLNELKQSLEKCKQLRIAFVIISEGVYANVKQQAEQTVGCLTQCLSGSTVLNKLSPSTISNILLKVNAKCGGVNHILSTPPPIMKAPVMIMGADVTHPSPHSEEPSVAAVTASHDLKASKYNISCRIQKPTLEIIQDLENMTRQHLLFFKKEVKELPAKIIFYRDGVSSGQFKFVLESEYQAILRACSKIQKNYNPSITFIVVQKRHHTRLFPENRRDGDKKNGNVPAGTCVDTEIVLPHYQNFFLVSHASIQGVARPTKYVTLVDENHLSNDELQCLTYYLCHMYVRCARSVSYPAPTYYAHLAALRGKAYINLRRFELKNLEREQQKFLIKTEIVERCPMFFV